jgi:hypothetical protein
MIKFIFVGLSLISIYVFSVPGDTISTFTLEGQPTWGAHGLAYDPADGNIWAAGPNDNNNCIFCKFKNDTSHSIVQNWQKLQGQYWVYDIGYPYLYSSIDTIVAVDMNSPRIKIYNKDNGQYLGSFSSDPFGSDTAGIDINKYDKLTSYASGYQISLIRKWNGYSWSDWATPGSHPLGVAFGWDHIFVIHTSPTYSIWVFNLDGTKDAEIKLNNWTSGLMYGLSRGRDNCVGENDSLYATCESPSRVIKEIEIGDYNTEIETTSIGDIKALFK